MKFSILIANYNNGKYFKECYDSIMAQDYSNWEAIIVDDKSTDDSIAVISSLIKDDTRFVFYYNEENKGCGYAKRKCVEFATGEICGFLDPDDAITKDAVSLMVEAHQAHPEISLAHSIFYYCDENLNIEHPFPLAKHTEVNKRFINMDGAVNHFAAFKLSFYKRTQGIHASLLRAVDQDLYLQLSETGPFYFINKPLYLYRIHKGGISTNNFLKAFYCHLKVVGMAEERRGVNLENEVESHLAGKGKPALYYESRLANPRFLLRKFLGILKRQPVHFIKKLVLNK